MGWYNLQPNFELLIKRKKGASFSQHCCTCRYVFEWLICVSVPVLVEVVPTSLWTICYIRLRQRGWWTCSSVPNSCGAIEWIWYRHGYVLNHKLCQESCIRMVIKKLANGIAQRLLFIQDYPSACTSSRVYTATVVKFQQYHFICLRGVLLTINMGRRTWWFLYTPSKLLIAKGYK